MRSYVKCRMRMTMRQRSALESLWSTYGLTITKGQPLCFDTVFKQNAPCILEIGFGMGDSLLEMAKNQPNSNFLGVEVHLPGVGSLLAGIEDANLTNIKLFSEDAVDVLRHSIPDNSLDRIQIFFPDPWPKRRHHKRRLINSTFVNLVANKLKLHGCLHIATDWQHYAAWILDVLGQSTRFLNRAGGGQYISRPAYRPLTKYECRGHRLGHSVSDFLFEKIL